MSLVIPRVITSSEITENSNARLTIVVYRTIRTKVAELRCHRLPFVCAYALNTHIHTSRGDGRKPDSEKIVHTKHYSWVTKKQPTVSVACNVFYDEESLYPSKNAGVTKLSIIVTCIVEAAVHHAALSVIQRNRNRSRSRIGDWGRIMAMPSPLKKLCITSSI